MKRETLLIELQTLALTYAFTSGYPPLKDLMESPHYVYLKLLIDGASLKEVIEQFDLDQAPLLPQTIEAALDAVVQARILDDPLPNQRPEFQPYCDLYAQPDHPPYDDLIRQYRKDKLFQEFLREAIHQMHSTDADRASLSHMEEAYSRLNPPLELKTFDLSIEVPETNRYHHSIRAYSADHAHMIIYNDDFNHTADYYNMDFGV